MRTTAYDRAQLYALSIILIPWFFTYATARVVYDIETIMEG